MHTVSVVRIVRSNAGSSGVIQKTWAPVRRISETRHLNDLPFVCHSQPYQMLTNIFIPLLLPSLCTTFLPTKADRWFRSTTRAFMHFASLSISQIGLKRKNLILFHSVSLLLVKSHMDNVNIFSRPFFLIYSLVAYKSRAHEPEMLKSWIHIIKMSFEERYPFLPFESNQMTHQSNTQFCLLFSLLFHWQHKIRHFLSIRPFRHQIPVHCIHIHSCVYHSFRTEIFNWKNTIYGSITFNRRHTHTHNTLPVNDAHFREIDPISFRPRNKCSADCRSMSFGGGRFV